MFLSHGQLLIPKQGRNWLRNCKTCGAVSIEMPWLLAQPEWFMDPLHTQVGCHTSTWKTKSKFGWMKQQKFWLVPADTVEVTYSDQKKKTWCNTNDSRRALLQWCLLPPMWIIASTGHWLDPAWQTRCYQACTVYGCKNNSWKSWDGSTSTPLDISRALISG